MRQKPRLSWQGIGISSNPNQREEPLSLHLQAYLEEAAGSADEHVIVVADAMQIQNYHALYGLEQSEARKIALKKGKKKQRELERILKAQGIKNVRVLRFSDVYGASQERVVQSVKQLFESDVKVRDAILKCVPKRIVKKASSLSEIAQYAITEIGLILSLPGTKFGHQREGTYDSVAAMLNTDYGIGRAPEFVYSKKGLEVVAGREGAIEPYSSLVSERRLLVTDSKNEFKRKLVTKDQHEAEILNKQLREDGMNEGESAEEFYKRKVAPSRKAIRAPKRRMIGVAASIAAGLISLVSSAAYVNADANALRQNRMSQISVFGLNGDIKTCTRAHDAALAKANSDIETKYGLKDYFND